MKEELFDYITKRIPVADIKDTVGDILKKFKENDWNETQYIFVTDEFNHLKGYFEFHKLLKCDSNVMTIDLMQPCHPVNVNHHTLEYIASHAIHKSISAVPVINDHDVFLGIIPSQIIMETLRSEHIDDLLKIAGIQKETVLAREAVEEPPIRSARHRLPWLLVGLAGTFISTFLMAGHEDMLNRYITLSFFVPGVVYLADAIGTQTETIVIRGLSLSWMGLGKNFE
jgi:magnesium transporter